MLSLLNLLNYLLNKPFTNQILFCLTAVIYYVVFYYLWDTVKTNNVYFVSVILLLLMDLAIIIFIFSYSSDYTVPKIEKSKKNKKKTPLLENNKNPVEDISLFKKNE